MYPKNLLAEAILKLGWSDMDDFASHIEAIATDDFGKPNDPRHIAQGLIEWARENDDSEGE